jgi:multicomponent Na+:H+ antiporter subunit G
MKIIGDILLIISGLFYALGGLGLLRMPDVYNRAQAGTKATTLGTFSVLIALCFYYPDWAPKLILILVFVAITNPVGSSTILKAAYKHGHKPIIKTEDVLEGYYEEVNDELS